MDELIESIFDDLAAGLSEEVGYNDFDLRAKVRNAAYEVRRTRRYPDTYTEEEIVEDMNRFYTNIRNIALYDYAQIGAEFQSYSGEGAIFRNFTDRNRLFYGVNPIAVCS